MVQTQHRGWSTPPRWIEVWLKCALALAFAGCGTTRVHPGRPLGPRPHESIQERLSSHWFPRLANQYQVCCRSRPAQVLFDELHLWDVAVIDPEATHNFREYLGSKGLLRLRNPDLVILAYFSAGDVNPALDQPIIRGFLQGLQARWFLRDAQGRQIFLYHLGGQDWTRALNMASDANWYLPAYVKDNLLNAALVDGVFFDWAATKMSWLRYAPPPRGGAVDIDNDGVADTDEKIDRLWVEGYRRMLENSRRLFPDGTVIVGNAGWNTGIDYGGLLNGIMIEQFLEGETVDGAAYGWSACMRTYAHYQRLSAGPRVNILMANDDDRGNFKLARFGLASTLMFDGYFCFTNRSAPTPSYQTAWWYDEYAVDLRTRASARDPRFKGYLGLPLSDARDVDRPAEYLIAALDGNGTPPGDRVWRRDYENGVVLVNPSGSPRTVTLEAPYRKIRGGIDPAFNDGATLRTVVLPERSGIILLRTVRCQTTWTTAALSAACARSNRGLSPVRPSGNSTDTGIQAMESEPSRHRVR